MGCGKPSVLDRATSIILYEYEPPMTMKRRSVAIFVGGTAAACLLLPLAVAFDVYVGAGFFSDVGPAENLTALAFLLAAVLSAMVADATRAPAVALRFRLGVAAQFWACAIMCLLLAGEEATFGREIRLLNDIDFRDTANPATYWAHVALSSGLLALSAASCFLHGRSRSTLFEVMAPHPGLVLPALVIWGVAVARRPEFQEIVEILAALYLAAHAALTLHKVRRLARRAAVAVGPSDIAAAAGSAVARTDGL